jgi:glycosyltransferase involved in cell wall biosynthesis
MHPPDNSSTNPGRTIHAVVFDPWCLVPYYTAALAKGLTTAGVTATIVSATYDLDPDCFRRMNVMNDPGLLDLFHGRMSNPMVRRGGKIVQGCINLLALAHRYVRLRPDIIHVQQLRLWQHGIPIELWLLRVARNMGSKLIYTVHNLLPHDTGAQHRAVFARLYREMDMLICHSDAVKERLMEEFSVPGGKLRVIPHGTLFAEGERPPAAEAKASLGIPAGEAMVLCQGFIRPYKGIEFLLESWSRVRQRSLPARLVIAGMGPQDYLNDLRSKAAALGVADSVDFRFSFAGVPELIAMYSAADAVVYPYREITSSGALMTGIAAGQVIIATDLAPFRGVLRNGENSLLVPYGDAHALSEGIVEVCRSPELRESLRRNVANAAPEYSWEEIGRSTRACYETVLGIGRSQSSLILSDAV